MSDKTSNNWLKLDNAATIYPSTLSRKFAAMFRLTVTLKDDIDIDILSKALNNVIDRFPTFKYKLKKGLFWYYFKKINKKTIIEKDYNNPMLRINFQKNNNYMFRVRYYKNRIAVEYFHALTDGYGGTIFISTLVGEYIRLKYKENITYNDYCLDPKRKPLEEEVRDDFYQYAKCDIKTTLEKEEFAYHYKGSLENKNILNIITSIIPLKSLKELANKYDVTITCLLVSLFILSIQEMYLKDKKKKNRPIKVSVPVNLRKYYNSKTMRNFSSYLNIGIDLKYGTYSFEEIINIVKNTMELNLTEKKLNAKFSANVKLTNNIFIRIMPLFIKKPVMSIVELMMGDRYATTTLSNLGLIKLPKEVEKYVKEMNFILGRSRGKPSSCSCVSYKDNLYLTFSRNIKESEFERIVLTKLVELNIPVLVESNRR